MNVRKNNGMTEFIPSLYEKKNDLMQKYVFVLLENLHNRLVVIEGKLGGSSIEADLAQDILYQVHKEILDVEKANSIRTIL